MATLHQLYLEECVQSGPSAGRGDDVDRVMMLDRVDRECGGDREWGGEMDDGFVNQLRSIIA